MHLLPQPIDLQRIFADQKLPQPTGDVVAEGGIDDRFDHLGLRIGFADPFQARNRVRTRTSTASWLLAVLRSTLATRKTWQMTSVIFMRNLRSVARGRNSRAGTARSRRNCLPPWLTPKCTQYTLSNIRPSIIRLENTRDAAPTTSVPVSKGRLMHAAVPLVFSLREQIADQLRNDVLCGRSGRGTAHERTGAGRRALA